ncbi:glycerophosphodiester phosphodiesterase family protein [Martelella radicis]|uniref:Glycerophosphoryl diester phosphodiesterase n=1 Tax=Martelella radicis TaxID=1397476 RepID=A0A7W6KIH3_9HYPH|nr:glycerophosphodiester phosphodiesterase family protein [Martelella radicis]MBB4121742.1 glycerophosphoryl diester phosphodiesterase [Martelella radicis]
MPPHDWLTARPIAHRGYHDMNKAIFENTMPAFERAIENNLAIECDVRLSADGKVIVFHDDDLSRLCGRSDTIEALEASAIDGIRVGTSEARIPRLAALLEATAGRVPLVIELKAGPSDPDVFARTVVAETAHYQGPLALMSFEPALLAALKRAGAACPLGLTADGHDVKSFDAHRETMRIGLDFVSYYYDDLPNDFVAGLRDSGVPVITWTVRNERARQITFQYADQMTFEGFDPA